MGNYNRQLLLKEASKIGSVPADTPLPKMKGWNPAHIKSGRDWIGKSPLLEKCLNSYLKKIRN